MLQAFEHSRNTNVFFHQVVIWREILVANWPVFAVAVMRSGMEVKITEAQAEAPPNVGATTGHAKTAHPQEWLIFRGGVGLFDVVHEPVGVVFAAGKSGLDRASLAQNFFRLVAVFQFEFRLPPAVSRPTPRMRPSR